MGLKNKEIKGYCIDINKKIIDVLGLFETAGTNLAIVINKSSKFLGIITSSDIRRAFIKGYNKDSSIKKIVNYKPLFLKDKVDENQLSNVISSSKFNNINPPLIPLIDKNDIPYNILNKQDLNLPIISKNKKIGFKPNILLIGGAGYIGTNLTKKFLEQGYRVTIFDKFIYLSKREMKLKLKSKNLILVDGDTRSIDQTFEVVKKNDIVIHLAELVGDPLCEKRPSKTYSVNYLASMTISNICKNLGISKFIYVSSCSVYGARKDENFADENSEINPLSVYGKLKALSEKTIIRNLGEYCRPCILRLGTVFGGSIRPRYDLVLNIFSGLIANNKKIIINGGEQWRPFVHINDVCDVIIKIIKLDKNKTNGQIFNIASYNFKISQIGKIIKKIYPTIKIENQKGNYDKRNYKVSSDKAKKILNFKPKVSIEKGIKDLVTFTKKNKIKNIKQKKYLNILNADKF
tara:strand:- start:2631 stop:4016 length:1386 start_codon:yes stop_codon:yes gene_type:complete